MSIDLEKRVELLESQLANVQKTLIRIVSKIGLPQALDPKDEEIVTNLSEALRRMSEGKDPLPVDLSARVRTDGKPLEDKDHFEIDPATGQQKAYIVLTPAERAKGFVRPVRQTYKHQVCGTMTTMGSDIAETYARYPGFYSGTYCAGCKAHFPVGAEGDFIWPEDGTKVGT